VTDMSVLSRAPLSRAPFGRVATAMVTPFAADGGVDLDGAAELAAHLVEAGNDAIVVNGTTGEAPTTSDSEKREVLRAIVGAIGGRARVLAGVGTFDTAHTVSLARDAERAGADGLLVVTPYYSKPPQAGLAAHFTAVADATGLPVMIYDIPGRTGVAVSTDTLVRLGEHPRIVAVKDAKDDLVASSWVLARSELAYYSGTDALTLPLLSIGGVGVVSVVAHVVTPEVREMVDAALAGEGGRALALHRRLLPVFEGFFRTQAVILTKAALRLAGLPAGPVRPPLVDASPVEIAQLRADLATAGLDRLVPLTGASAGGVGAGAGSGVAR
jgi:4-hydroxy-tetrahydrodipicolinate synthase